MENSFSQKDRFVTPLVADAAADAATASINFTVGGRVRVRVFFSPVGNVCYTLVCGNAVLNEVR